MSAIRDIEREARRRALHDSRRDIVQLLINRGWIDKDDERAVYETVSDAMGIDYEEEGEEQ